MTWSIIFHERSSGRIAIAVATKFFAVGARVPNIEPQKGAVCTQAMTNPLYGPHGLRLIREAVGAADVVRILTTPDAGREHRQVHVMGADAKFAAHTGASNNATDTASHGKCSRRLGRFMVDRDCGGKPAIGQAPKQHDLTIFAASWRAQLTRP